jgi:hypothetical protein
MKHFYSIFFPIFFLLFAQGSYAQQISGINNQVERIIEVKTENDNLLLAKKELNDKATEKVIEELLKEIIGEVKLGQNRSLIQKKIISQSSKFIPLVKTGEPIKLEPAGYAMTLTMKVNIKDLQTLLMDLGLFYEGDGTPIAVPFIKWVDKDNGQTLSWWVTTETKPNGLLKSLSQKLDTNLKTHLFKNAFYLVRPQSLNYSSVVPNELSGGPFRLTSWMTWLTQWNFQVVIDGQVTIAKSKVRIGAYSVDANLQAIQVQNGRTIAEVSQTFETEPGVQDVVIDKKWKEISEALSAELSSQMFDSWQKGAIGSSLYKLTVNGNLTIPQQELLKEWIKNQVREVKSIKEGNLSQNVITYEIDSTLSMEALAQKIPVIDLNGRLIKMNKFSASEIFYQEEKR